MREGYKVVPLLLKPSLGLFGHVGRRRFLLLHPGSATGHLIVPGDHHSLQHIQIHFGFDFQADFEKLQHYLSIILILFNVIYRTLVGEVLPFCRDTFDVFYSPSRLGWAQLYTHVTLIITTLNQSLVKCSIGPKNVVSKRNEFAEKKHSKLESQ